MGYLAFPYYHDIVTPAPRTLHTKSMRFFGPPKWSTRANNIFTARFNVFTARFNFIISSRRVLMPSQRVLMSSQRVLISSQHVLISSRPIKMGYLAFHYYHDIATSRAILARNQFPTKWVRNFLLLFHIHILIIYISQGNHPHWLPDRKTSTISLSFLSL